MTNVGNFETYYWLIDQGQLPYHIDERPTREDREQEYIILSMRLLQGFDIDFINQRFGIDFLNKYQEAVEKHLQTGLIQIKDNRLQFTQRGLDIGNQFYLDII